MNETTLSVSGMSCRSCINHINRAVGKLGNIHAVNVDLRGRTVRIQHASAITGEQLAAAISGAGYPAKVG